jgi:hypothetical protein
LQIIITKIRNILLCVNEADQFYPVFAEVSGCALLTPEGAHGIKERLDYFLSAL